MKRRFFYLIFLLSTGLVLTELGLKIPLVKKFVSRPGNYAPEIPSTAGYTLSTVRAKELLAHAAGPQANLQTAENIGMDDSAIKNEPVSPLSYMKGRAADLKGASIRSVKTENGSGRIIYDVKYSFDTQRRRKTLPENALSPAERNYCSHRMQFCLRNGG
jgi:hypothetical protein